MAVNRAATKRSILYERQKRAMSSPNLGLPRRFGINSGDEAGYGGWMSPAAPTFSRYSKFSAGVDDPTGP
jgi:hypothetical protein